MSVVRHRSFFRLLPIHWIWRRVIDIAISHMNWGGRGMKMNAGTFEHRPCRRRHEAMPARSNFPNSRRGSHRTRWQLDVTPGSRRGPGRRLGRRAGDTSRARRRRPRGDGRRAAEYTVVWAAQRMGSALHAAIHRGDAVRAVSCHHRSTNDVTPPTAASGHEERAGRGKAKPVTSRPAIPATADNHVAALQLQARENVKFNISYRGLGPVRPIDGGRSTSTPISSRPRCR